MTAAGLLHHGATSHRTPVTPRRLWWIADVCTLPERMQFMRFSQCDHDWPRSRGANSFGGVGQLLNPEAAGKPAHPAMERCRDRHCRRGAAALLFGFRRPGAQSPRVSSRPRTQPALCNRRAFSLPPSLTQAAPGWRAPGNSVEAIEPPVWGHPNETPGTQRSTSEPRRRRDSGKPAGESIRGEGYTDAGHGRQTH